MTPDHQPPRVLLLGNLAESVLRFRGALLEEMLRRGIEVHAAAPALSQENDMSRQLSSMGVQLHDLQFSRAGMNPLADVVLLFSLRRLLRRVRPSHVLAYTIKPVSYGMLAAKWVGVPHRVALINGLGFAFSEATGIKKWLASHVAKLLYHMALRSSSVAFFQNPDDQTQFSALGLLPPRLPVHVVNGSGVSLEEYSPVAGPAGPMSFVLIARLLGQKGVREYASAARILRREFPQARCHLVGGYDANPDSVKPAEVQAWEREGLMEYHGTVADVRPILAASHVFVLPSYYREGVPRTILEAMAMGRAVITCDTPGCRETVVHGDNGFLVAPRSAEALATAMQEFLHDPDLARRMGERSRVRAAQKYDVRKVNAAMLAGMGL